MKHPYTICTGMDTPTTSWHETYYCKEHVATVKQEAWWWGVILGIAIGVVCIAPLAMFIGRVILDAR